MSTPQVKKKKSLLRGSENFVAQSVKINVGGDDYRFDIRELSAAAREVVNDFPEQLAEMLGIEPETVRNQGDFAEWMAQNAREVLSEETGETARERFESAVEQNWNVALIDALAGWNLPEPCSPENKVLLPKVVKRTLFQAIEAGSSLGAGAENLFR